MKLKKKNLNVNDVEKKLNIHLIDCVKNVHRFNYIIKYMKLEWNKFVLLGLLTKLFKKHKLSKQFVILVSTKETREMKSRQQEKTYYRLFNWIAKHLWYNIQEVKIYFMIWCFWSKKLKLSKTEMEIPVISQTRDLTKEQAIFLIDTLIEFTKIKNIPVKITPLELQSLYDSFN